jgi:NADPH:quinone reductase-like Zn-dependent oxidoreductase
MSQAVKYNEFGPASVLRVVEVQTPQAGPGKVRIAVRTAGINPADYKGREGQFHGPSFSFPAGIGRELAGVVDQLGEGVTEFRVGDEVFGTLPSGAIAEYAVVKAGNLAPKPAGLDWVSAGGLALAGTTAWDSVASQNLTADDTLLVSAAAGGVGVLVCQLARLAGATVLGTAGAANHEFLRGLGVVPVAYGGGLVDRIRAAAPQGVTVVFDHHGAETIEAGLALGVAPERINTIAADPADFGVVRVGRGPANPDTLAKLAALVVEGSLLLPIEATYPMGEVVAAFDRLEAGHARGKIVVEIR